MKLLDKLVVSNYDYDLHSKDSNIYALIGFLAHLFFYVILHYVFGLKEYLGIRIVIACLFLAFYILPNDHWRVGHKFYYEAVIYLTLPVFFSVMMFANGNNIFWTVSYLFSIVIYTIFSALLFNILAHLSLLIIVPILQWAYQVDQETLFTFIGVYMVSVLAAALLTLFKERVVVEYQKKKLMNELMMSRNELVSSLLYISSELSMYDDLDQVFNVFIERFKSIMDLSSMGLILCKGEGFEVIKYGLDGVTLEQETVILSTIKDISKNETLILSTSDSDEMVDPWYVFNRSYTLVNSGGVDRYNLILLLHREALKDFEIGIFQIFLEQLSGNIRTRFMSRELELYSKTDSLTKLYNRSAYDEAFNVLTYDYNQTHPFAIIFGDINGLKYINDTYGHTDGDLLIRTCSDIIKASLPEGVRAYRYGGDEVIILLKDTTLVEAEAVTKSLEDAFMDREILCTNEKTGETKMETLAISFGTVASDEGPFIELLDMADVRMREKKDQYYKSTYTGRYR